MSAPIACDKYILAESQTLHPANPFRDTSELLLDDSPSPDSIRDWSPSPSPVATPPRSLSRLATYSSPSSTMPPFPLVSEGVLQGLLQGYHGRISRMRRGEDLGQGPYLLGTCTCAEGQKFSEQQDRRYPILILPSLDTPMVTVWLMGDPTGVHEALASMFNDFIGDSRRLHPSPGTDVLLSLNDFLSRALAYMSSPRTTVTARQAGQIKGRRFATGNALKEPDGMFFTGPGFPPERATAFCAVEVAFNNEDIPALIFESHLWSQRSNVEGSLPGRRGLNFIGVHVTKKAEFLNNREFKFAFAILLCPSVEDSHSPEVFIFNGANRYVQDWRSALERGVIGTGAVHEDEPLLLPLAYVCSPMKAIQEIRELCMVISLEDLVNRAQTAEAWEDSDGADRTEGFDVRSLYTL